MSYSEDSLAHRTGHHSLGEYCICGSTILSPHRKRLSSLEILKRSRIPACKILRNLLLLMCNVCLIPRHKLTKQQFTVHRSWQMDGNLVSHPYSLNFPFPEEITGHICTEGKVDRDQQMYIEN